ncbi:MAG: sulfatase-like hydrolase/transferase [Verrucomicrobia bacterium]|jgi:arylsulfatase A-like enzyme|nr:sulfatase-like hydrolase/transferase [Verrucomicrobiota bacterium]
MVRGNRFLRAASFSMWMHFGFMAASLANAQTRPNIVLILSDDQAWYDYSFMRMANAEQAAINMNPDIYQVADTPAIDRLAANGLVFTHGYVPVSLCRPSLASIITGTYPCQHKITGNDPANSNEDDPYDDLIYRVPSLPRILEGKLGYSSYQSGKWWQGPHTKGGFAGGETVNAIDTSTSPSQWSGALPFYAHAREGDWGLMVGRVDYVTDVEKPDPLTNYANTIVPITDYIDGQVAASEPFFLWYAPFLPHYPYDPPTNILTKYDSLIAEPEENNDYIAKYYGNIERLDGGIDALMDHLDSTGLATNTMVVFVCDNGWISRTNSADHANKSKRSLYDGGTRTPIIIYWPDQIRPGGTIEPQIVDTPVSSIDIASTILAAFDLDPAPQMSGINLMDLDAVTVRTNIFGSLYEDNEVDIETVSETLIGRWCRQDGWKLIMRESGTRELYQLYDSATGAPVDPFETNDVSAANAARVSQLSQTISNWYDNVTDPVRTVDQEQDNVNGIAALSGTMGQTFTPATANALAGIRIPLLASGNDRDMTLEVRQLDGQDAPLGSLLAQSALSADLFVPGETRWYTFLLDSAYAQASGTPIGFTLNPGSGTGTFQLPYKTDNPYADGAMYFAGTLSHGGTDYEWTNGFFDLAFETFTESETNSELTLVVGESAAATNMAIWVESDLRGVPMQLETSTNLTNSATWTALSANVDRSREGFAAWTVPVDKPIEFFRARESVARGSVQTNGVLYYETFSGDGSASLRYNSPTTNNYGDGTAVWSSDYQYMNNGLVQTGNHARGMALLPFEPQTGHIYELSATILNNQASNWIALGFCESGTFYEYGDFGNIGGIVSGYGWILTRNGGGTDAVSRTGEGTDGGVAWTDVDGAQPVDLKISLVTTGSTWTADFNINGSDVATGRAMPASAITNINGVGFSAYDLKSSATISDFKLEVQTP